MAVGLAHPTRWAEVDLGAISSNTVALRQAVPQPVRLCAVVKADAYGHGAVPVGRAALAAGADWLAVATPDEALELHRAAIAAPTLVLGATPPSQAEAVVGAGIRLCVYDRGAIEAASAAARATGQMARLHLKVDTGMTRLGCSPGGEVVELARLATSLEGVELEAFWTHLAEADTPESPRTGAQLRLFLGEVERLHQAGIRPSMLHCCNSAGALLHPEARLDMVRCGLPLYGYPSGPGEDVALRPAMTWKAQVVALHRVEAGDHVGYGGTFTAPEPRQIATISVGYGDGYQRRLSNRGEVLLKGSRVPVVGRVSMDFITVDATDVEVEIGDEAILLGCDGPARLGADEVAGWLDTIAYEVLCQVGRRVPRVYRDA